MRMDRQNGHVDGHFCPKTSIITTLVLAIFKTLVKNIPKKPKRTKRKPVVQHDDGDEVSIMESLKNLAIVEPSFSSAEAMLYTLERHKITHLASLPLVAVPTSHAFETPQKLRGVMSTLGPLFGNHTGLDLILADSFVRIIEKMKEKGAFGLPYNDIMAFLSKVSLLTNCILLYILSTHFDLYDYK